MRRVISVPSASRLDGAPLLPGRPDAELEAVAHREKLPHQPLDPEAVRLLDVALRPPPDVVHLRPGAERRVALTLCLGEGHVEPGAKRRNGLCGLFGLSGGRLGGLTLRLRARPRRPLRGQTHRRLRGPSRPRPRKAPRRLRTRRPNRTPAAQARRPARPLPLPERRHWPSASRLPLPRRPRERYRRRVHRSPAGRSSFTDGPSRDMLGRDLGRKTPASIRHMGAIGAGSRPPREDGR